MKYYTVAEVASKLGFKEQSVRNMIYQKRIKTVKIFGATRISQEELDRIIKEV